MFYSSYQVYRKRLFLENYLINRQNQYELKMLTKARTL